MKLSDDPTNPYVEFCEASTFYAEALSIAHRRCFEVFWSNKDFYDLLTLKAVFGFIATIEDKKSESSEAHRITAANINSSGFGGFILCSAASDQCEVLTICVLPEWRRKGLAINLMQNAMKRAKNIGVSEIFLEVAENNDIARNLYINLGFKEFGRRDLYYRQKKKRVDAIQLSKIISH
jgi:ribosomal protein S18 acetylase RimI-like enzyme